MQTIFRFLAIYCLAKRSYKGYSRKNPNRRGWGQRVWGPLEFSDLSLYPWKSQTKWNFTPGNSTNWCYTHRNFHQGQKPRPMEIPNDFFWINPGNSTSFCIGPRKFHILFIQYRNFMSSTLPVWIFSGIAPYLPSFSCLNWVLLNKSIALPILCVLSLK